MVEELQTIKASQGRAGAYIKILGRQKIRQNVVHNSILWHHVSLLESAE
jgi:hypothetical protein